MKFSSALLSNVLFATTILAAPRGMGSTVQQRAAARLRRTNPIAVISEEDRFVNGNITHAQTSTNWGGAVITSPPAGTTFNGVSGQFTIPSITPPPGAAASGSWSGSAWVGIDGDTFQNAILQSGVDFTVTKRNGATSFSYDAWFEWFPNFAIDFSGISLAAGNVISVSVHATTTSTGTVVLENLTTGQTVSTSVSAPSSSSHLGGQNAEWIVEDFDEGNAQVAFADYGTVTFTNTVATTVAGTSVGVSGATIIDMVSSSGAVLSSATIPSSSSVKLTYE